MPDPATTQATFCATLVDEWARAGVRHAVLAPGSRSTPMALALLRDDRIAVHVHHDERCAGFMALGFGLASIDTPAADPAVALCTSGTAATHFHAAVVEAHQAGVPLLVCTADRPPELRDVGAPQAIDQTHLYGRAVRWFHDPGVADEATRHAWRSLGSRAVAEARTGPVHLNLPFREPLVGDPDELPPGRPDPHTPFSSVSGRGSRARWHSRSRGCGGRSSSPGGRRRPAATSRCSPIPRSGLARRPPRRRAPAGAGSARASSGPTWSSRVGPPPASRVVNEWIAGIRRHRGRRPALARPVAHGRPPSASAGAARPRARLARAVARAGRARRDGHRRGARRPPGADRAGDGPRAPRRPAGRRPPRRRLVDADPRPRVVRRRPVPTSTVHANRGANGIDGTMSTAIGVALATGAPTAVLLGDVAFLHDSQRAHRRARTWHRPHDRRLDNDGGGIFSFLPQAATLPPPDYELLFGTPHGVRPEELAAAHGLTSLTVEAADAVALAVEASVAAGGVHLVVVRTDRRRTRSSTTSSTPPSPPPSQGS